MTAEQRCVVCAVVALARAAGLPKDDLIQIQRDLLVYIAQANES